MDKAELQALKRSSMQLRLDVLKVLKHKKYGHLGGAMSIIELMSVLYNKQLKYDPKNPDWEDRDYVVLSKGHAGPAWYAALAEKGFFDKEGLYTLNDGGTRFPSHPDRNKIPGVDATSGSLGQGLSVAVGLGYALRMEGKTDQYVYAIVGDGEMNEGQCWESFEFLANYKMNQVIVIIDWNKMQLDGYTKDIMYPFDLAKKMEAFGFRVIPADGTDEESISDAIDEAKKVTGSAVCILMDSLKANGVPYYIGRTDNHGPKFDAEADAALAETIALLEASLNEKGGE